MSEALPCYLDTQAAIWLAQGDYDRFCPKIRAIIDAGDLLISQMAFLEMEYLFEIGRIHLRADEVRLVLFADHGVRLCDLDWAKVTRLALQEKWTHDPFDRLIVANAKANGMSTLVSADARIRENYPKAAW